MDAAVDADADADAEAGVDADADVVAPCGAAVVDAPPGDVPAEAVAAIRTTPLTALL